jgi:hypothetical protein
MSDLRPYLELAYFVSGVAIAIIAAFGLEQIRVLKKDVSIRVERAAKEKAIEYSGRYLTVFVPLFNLFYDERTKKQIPKYEGPLGDFTPPSVSGKYRENLKKRFLLIREVLPAVNELNYIASAFVHGVADDRTGFQIIGRTFCGAVTEVYDFVAAVRSDSACQYWEPIVQLYNTWSSRLSRTELEALRSGLDRRIAGVSETGFRCVGDEAL